MKKYCSFLLLFTLTFYFSQQTDRIKLIKEKYDAEIQKVKDAYAEEASKIPSKKRAKIALKKENDIYDLELKREIEYKEELEKIQSAYPISDINLTLPKDDDTHTMPKYPGGIDAFKKEIINNFNNEAVQAKGTVQSIVIFVIEKDGSIIIAKAFGENLSFNRQAELAVMLIQKKWEPAIEKGLPQRARMRVPLTLKFD